MKTLADVVKAKHRAEARLINKENAQKAKFEVAKNLHPAIGALMTAKGVKYYAYVAGIYTEGTVEQLTAKLILN
jgi:hypothetical protein